MVRFVEGADPEGDWLSMLESAELWSRIAQHRISDQTIRRWVMNDNWAVEDVRAWHPRKNRYYIDRTSLLDSWEAYCHRALEVIEEERKRLRS
jgi:hypothetical protein